MMKFANRFANRFMEWTNNNKHSIVQFLFMWVVCHAIFAQKDNTILNLVGFIAIIGFGVSNYLEGRKNAYDYIPLHELMNWCTAVLEFAEEKDNKKSISQQMAYEFNGVKKEVEVVIRRPVKRTKR